MKPWRIYVPYTYEGELLDQALEGLGRYRERALVIDNSPKGDLRCGVETYVPDVSLSWAQVINLASRMASRSGNGFFLWMHADAVPNEAAVEALLAVKDDPTLGVAYTNYDVLCLYRTEATDKVRWDPYLPYYFCDLDYNRRLSMAGYELKSLGIHGVEHLQSQAKRRSQAYGMCVDLSWGAWQKYYLAKWGMATLSSQPTYEHPWNNPLHREDWR